MKKLENSDVIISGVGVTSAIGQGKTDFTNALLAGQHNFAVMQRPGRQTVLPDANNVMQPTRYIGAEIAKLNLPDWLPRHELRTTSFTGQVALATLDEAWQEANLNDVDPTRIGLVIGGSNVQQRELTNHHDKFKDRVHFLRPTYGMSFMDSDLCGVCSMLFGIKGFAYTIGGASASGQVAVIQAIEAVRSGRVDVCIALGALMDLSYWELQGFRALGAMGSNHFADNPAAACRPFDRQRDGFIFGESCAAMVIERVGGRVRCGIKPYCRVAGWAMAMDGNRNPNPSFDGEVSVIEQALAQAGLAASAIDYVNPHGTGSNIGDEIELKALEHCGLNHAYLNATKSITGHGLTAAGATELAATLLQMRHGQLHPSRNLDNPMATQFQWVTGEAKSHQINHCLKMSMGFGGVNTATCLQRY